MNKHPHTNAGILLVDDKPDMLEVMTARLQNAGYTNLQSAQNGDEAWRRLKNTPSQFDLVLLDWMMPGEVDGLGVLKRIKKHDILKPIPVILQTAKVNRESMLQGLEAGAYYYLEKPYEKPELLALVAGALMDRMQYKSLHQKMQMGHHAAALLTQATFPFRTLKDVEALKLFFMNVCHKGLHIAMGLVELMINAVEHGNLGITYEEKSQLMNQGLWESEVTRRLRMPQYRDRQATVFFQRSTDEMQFFISDQGNGFDWEKYIKPDPDRLLDTHGRGISLFASQHFDRLEYQGKGNEVLATAKVTS